ncbi:MAG: efflux RND transporter permease subunit [Thermotogota bacterium]
MNKYVEFVNKNRLVLTIIFIITIILALLGIRQIEVGNDFNVFKVEGSRYEETMEEMEKYFSTTEQISFMVEFETESLNMDIFNQMAEIQNKIENVEKINALNGPAPEKIPIGGTLKNISDLTEENIPQIKEYYKTLSAMSPLVQKEEKLYGIYNIFPGENFGLEEINKIEDFLIKNNYKYYATGDLYMQQKIGDYVKMILSFLPPAAFFLIFLVFRIKMGNIKATILAVLPAGIGAIWTLGLIGWFGGEVSIITVLAPIFTIVIGSADGLHFISHIQEAKSEGHDKLSAITHTLKMVGIPMIVTTITSIAGFMSLMFMNTEAINNLAVFASIGIAFAGIATWYILPLILTGKIKLKSHKEKEKSLSTGIKKLWGKKSIIILIALIIISFIFIPNLKNEFNLLMVYREYTDIYKSFDKFMEINSGSVPVFGLIKTENNILSSENANIILDYQKELEEKDAVSKTMSVYDLYSILNQRLFDKEKPEYPNNQFQIMLINNILNQSSTNPVSNLLADKDNVSRMIIFPNSLRNDDLKTIQQITNKIQRDNDINIEVTGVQYLMYDLNQSMIKNQTGSLIIAFGLIILLLWISLKKIIPALVSLIPIAATVIILFGFLAISGISLNLITTTIFSITLGVGIDYAVHFTSVWKNYKEKGFTSNESADKAYKYTSRPIIANAFGLAIGLSAMLLSPLQIHVYVSTLMWVSMITAVFLSLSVLPTILRKLK